MNQLTVAGGVPLTMSSREIAKLTGKESRHVARDIKVLREQLGDMFVGYVQDWTHPQNGVTYKEFILDKDTCLTLLLGYDAQARMRVVKRWQELESEQQKAAFPIPKSLPEALRLAADLSEQNERLALERDTAVRTKAEIGSRREATAMATAAAKTKEVARLKHELGRSQQHATVIAVEKATGRKFAKNAYVALRRATKEYGLAAVEVVDARYGSVKAWPAIAWREAYGIELADIFPSAEAA